MVDYLGWAATAVFVASYFCREPAAMRRVQMAGAAMWIAYGVLMHAAPVVVANLLVLSAAAWTGTRSLKGRRPPSSSAAQPDSHPAGVRLEPDAGGIRG